MRKKLLFYLLFFAGLLAAFYYFLFYGNDYNKVKLPVLSHVQPFNFTNQLGDSVTQHTTEGKVYVTNFFFVTCRSICPYMNNNINKIYKQFENDNDVLFISHTCQPEYDSLPALKYYADSLKINNSKWHFVTGNKLQLYKMARESYKIDDPKNNVGKIEDQFLHSQFIALVDKWGRVRGIYDGIKKDEMEKLAKDITDVTKEVSSQRFVNGIFTNNPG
jgi:protein SCO1